MVLTQGKPWTLPNRNHGPAAKPSREIFSIVIYIYGNKPELMTKVFNAIKEAKTNTSVLWSKSDTDKRIFLQEP